MKKGNGRITPLALALLAAAAAAACATPDGGVRPRATRETEAAREVVVRTKVDGRSVVVTPDPAYVRVGQTVVFASCCETLRVTWKEPVRGIPEPRCEGGECTLVAPEVKERTEVLYEVSGRCGPDEFRLDPMLIFIR
jgi:hypothetical protein